MELWLSDISGVTDAAERLADYHSVAAFNIEPSEMAVSCYPAVTVVH